MRELAYASGRSQKHPGPPRGALTPPGSNFEHSHKFRACVSLKKTGSPGNASAVFRSLRGSFRKTNRFAMAAQRSQCASRSQKSLVLVASRRKGIIAQA
jgi:hypothetical protein